LRYSKQNTKEEIAFVGLTKEYVFTYGTAISSD